MEKAFNPYRRETKTERKKKSDFYILEALETLNAAYDYLPREDEDEETLSLAGIRLVLNNHYKKYIAKK